MEAFYSVAAGLEEFAVHLVQPALVHIEALHPSASAESPAQEAPLAGLPRQQQPAGGVWDYSWVEVLWELGFTHKNPMVSSVRVLCRNAAASPYSPVCRDVKLTQLIGPLVSLVFSWQVGRMMAQVLFERDCSSAWLSKMSVDFVVNVLIPAMESNSHHKAEAGSPLDVSAVALVFVAACSRVTRVIPPPSPSPFAAVCKNPKT
jgi:hypothetical protein